MKTVLLDANFLMLPELQGMDFYSELKNIVSGSFQLATLSSVVSELEKMQDSKSKRGRAAKIALALLKKNKVFVFETALKADASIVEYALSNRDVIVCTNDREIKTRLKKEGVQLISPKGRKYITVV